MNRVARKGLVTAMVTGGVLASAGYAQADSAAEGAGTGSPGVLSGNTVQVPVDIPLNACGNTINVVGLLNPAIGNGCANTSQRGGTSRSRDARASNGARPARPSGPGAVDPGGPRRAGSAAGKDAPARSLGSALLGSGAGAQALAGSGGSAGVLAGNVLALPLHLPINVSGNSVDVVGIGDPAFGNSAVGTTPVTGGTPPATVRTPPPPPAHRPIPAPPANPGPSRSVATENPVLAHTGAEDIGGTAAWGAGLLLGGALLARRFRPGRD
ncbi:Small secreted domain [Streptomyces sp. DvalAA-14]|uniref:chaplin n=1 Tax=unclassified Streptomyces TaxID=2593676 RepID=UPI00081B02D6|nr:MULTISPECIES: chaplin [unclassified Streptomyces]MYS23440.1 DUF320 domain-containing protein [Streptomyces sp. SID4948]SCE33278.1 Small secreted domain [Streptomyces sp. DvalAA-14]